MIAVFTFAAALAVQSESAGPSLDERVGQACTASEKFRTTLDIFDDTQFSSFCTCLAVALPAQMDDRGRTLLASALAAPDTDISGAMKTLGSGENPDNALPAAFGFAVGQCIRLTARFLGSEKR